MLFPCLYTFGAESQSMCVINMNTGMITSGRCLPLDVRDDSGEDASFAVIVVFVPGTTVLVSLCQRCIARDLKNVSGL